MAKSRTQSKKIVTVEDARAAVLGLQPLVDPLEVRLYLAATFLDDAGPGELRQSMSFYVTLTIGAEGERDKGKCWETTINAKTPAEIYASLKRWLDLMLLAQKTAGKRLERHRTAPDTGPRRLSYQPVEPLFE